MPPPCQRAAGGAARARLVTLLVQRSLGATADERMSGARPEVFHRFPVKATKSASRRHQIDYHGKSTCCAGLRASYPSGPLMAICFSQCLGSHRVVARRAAGAVPREHVRHAVGPVGAARDPGRQREAADSASDCLYLRSRFLVSEGRVSPEPSPRWHRRNERRRQSRTLRDYSHPPFSVTSALARFITRVRNRNNSNLCGRAKLIGAVI